jgi:hypothetical protein
MKRFGFVIILLLLAMSVTTQASAATSITFEGYKSGEGTPSPGGVVGSSATGPTDPWYGSYAYIYMDGWNDHSPTEHAGQGTYAQGWTSLDNDNAWKYLLDFEGYEFDRNTYITDMGSARYGHEDRWYDGSEATWSIKIVGETVIQIAHGEMSELYLDIDYGLASGNPNITGVGTFIAADDDGAFYDELMDRFGTAVLKFTFNVDEPPTQAENPLDPLALQWAIYGGQITLTPVPEPSTLVLLGMGALALAFFGRRRRKA